MKQIDTNTEFGIVNVAQDGTVSWPSDKGFVNWFQEQAQEIEAEEENNYE